MQSSGDRNLSSGHDLPGKPFSPAEDDDEEESFNDDYEQEACEPSCCDLDCECDDCLRCANNSLQPYDDLAGAASAA
jgi:hypothetical protein